MAFIQNYILFGDHSEGGWSAEKKEVNKNPKFDANFYTSIMTWRAHSSKFDAAIAGQNKKRLL